MVRIEGTAKSKPTTRERGAKTPPFKARQLSLSPSVSEIQLCSHRRTSFFSGSLFRIDPRNLFVSSSSRNPLEILWRIASNPVSRFVRVRQTPSIDAFRTHSQRLLRSHVHLVSEAAIQILVTPGLIPHPSCFPLRSLLAFLPTSIRILPSFLSPHPHPILSVYVFRFQLTESPSTNTCPDV